MRGIAIACAVLLSGCQAVIGAFDVAAGGDGGAGDAAGDDAAGDGASGSSSGGGMGGDAGDGSSDAWNPPDVGPDGTLEGGRDAAGEARCMACDPTDQDGCACDGALCGCGFSGSGVVCEQLTDAGGIDAPCTSQSDCAPGYFCTAGNGCQQVCNLKLDSGCTLPRLCLPTTSMAPCGLVYGLCK